MLVKREANGTGLGSIIGPLLLLAIGIGGAFLMLGEIRKSASHQENQIKTIIAERDSLKVVKRLLLESLAECRQEPLETDNDSLATEMLGRTAWTFVRTLQIYAKNPNVQQDENFKRLVFIYLDDITEGGWVFLSKPQKKSLRERFAEP